MEKETSHIVEGALTEVAQHCLCLQIRQAARLITQWYDEALQPSGLRSTQFNLLAAIALAKTVSLTRLAEAMVMDRTTLTRNLKPLESQELVVIAPGADRRVRLIRLTARGYQRLQEALPCWRKAQELVMARLGRSQWDALHTDLHGLMTQAP